MQVAAPVPRFNLRFSVKGVIYLMAGVAVGAAAFRDASPAWTTVVTSVAIVSILFAILASRYGRRDHQAFWTGFAICAVAYFLFVVRFETSRVVRVLATTVAIDFVSDHSHPWLNQTSGQPPEIPVPVARLAPARLTPPARFGLSAVLLCAIPPLAQACSFNFRVGDDVQHGIFITGELPYIGQGQCTLLLGFFGGFLAHGFAARRSRDRRDPAKTALT